MAQIGLFYVRSMDDWIALSPTRWELRRAIAAVNRTLAAMQLDKHPDQTARGRTTAGFDFLGYRFSPGGLRLAPPNRRKIQSTPSPLPVGARTGHKP